MSRYFVIYTTITIFAKLAAGSSLGGGSIPAAPAYDYAVVEPVVTSDIAALQDVYSDGLSNKSYTSFTSAGTPVYPILGSTQVFDSSASISSPNQIALTSPTIASSSAVSGLTGGTSYYGQLAGLQSTAPLQPVNPGIYGLAGGPFYSMTGSIMASTMVGNVVVIGSNVVYFDGRNGFNLNSPYVINVPGAEIPEPGTWTMLLGGGGMISLFAYRRRRARS